MKYLNSQQEKIQERKTICDKHSFYYCKVDGHLLVKWTHQHRHDPKVRLVPEKYSSVSEIGRFGAQLKDEEIRIERWVPLNLTCKIPVWPWKRDCCPILSTMTTDYVGHFAGVTKVPLHEHLQANCSHTSECDPSRVE